MTATIGAIVYLVVAILLGSRDHSARVNQAVTAIGELGRLAFLAGLIGYCLSTK